MSDSFSIDPNAALQKAQALQQSGNVMQAAAIYRQLLRQYPSEPRVLYLLGTAELQLGNAEQSVSLLGKSLKISPNQPRALCNLGIGLHNLGRLDEALASYDRAISLNPGYAMAYNNRGNTLLNLDRQKEALASFDQAIALEPNYAEAYNNRGNILREFMRLDEALASFDRAIALNSNYAVAHCNRGSTLADLGLPDDALVSFDRAIALDRDYAGAHCHRGGVLLDLKRLDEALASCDRAIALDPGLVDAYFRKSLVRLLTGDFAEGLELYEWRWKTAAHKRNARNFSQPLWTGDQPLAGKTLLVHAEQGLGDFVQFCRYAPMALSLGAKVVIEVPKRLLPLLLTLKGDFIFVEKGRPLPDFDLHCPVMSLPLAFKTRLETIPAEVPYLFADPDKRQEWRRRLGDKTRPRIGLVWSGNPQHKSDRSRSIALKRFAPLLQLPFEFHSLQIEIQPEDAAALPEFPQLRTHRDDQNDFSDAAALIAAMDLVITVDTAVAHIAGALGKPVWILLPWVPDWRWLLERSDSPWYPTATLFRQPAMDDWSSVIAEVSDRLSQSDGIA